MKEKKAKPNDSYYMLINSKCPGVILECGFLSNPDESERLKDEKYQADLAEIICEGIDEQEALDGLTGAIDDGLGE